MQSKLYTGMHKKFLDWPNHTNKPNTYTKTV